MEIKELCTQLGVDALVLWHPSEILWATGFSQGGCAVITNREVSLITSEVPTETPDGLHIIPYDEYGFAECAQPTAAIKRALKGLLTGCRKVGFTGGKTPVQAPVPFPGIAYIDVTEEIEERMLCKPDEFLEKVMTAVGLNDLAFEQVRAGLLAGMDEFDVRALVERTYQKETGRLLQTGGDYLSGRRTADIAGPPTGRVILQGDPVIVDIQVACEGAAADTTRTFFCGEPEPEMKRAYEAVAAVLIKMEPLLKPGIRANEVYRHMSALLQAEGLPPLPHHAGHGVGYRFYEAPYLIPSETQPLRPGMIVALEPGAYTGKFGIRLENNYRITESGCINLTSAPVDLSWAITATKR